LNQDIIVGAVIVVVIVWLLYLELPMQSVPITTKDVSSNPAHGVVYSIQQYVIKLFSDLPQVGGFHRVLRFHQPIQLTATISMKYCWKWS